MLKVRTQTVNLLECVVVVVVVVFVGAACPSSSLYDLSDPLGRQDELMASWFRLHEHVWNINKCCSSC